MVGALEFIRVNIELTILRNKFEDLREERVDVDRQVKIRPPSGLAPLTTSRKSAQTVARARRHGFRK